MLWSHLSTASVTHFAQPRIDLGRHKDAILETSDVLNLVGGQIGVPLALFTMAAARTAREKYPALLNFMVVFVVFSTSNLLLWVKELTLRFDVLMKWNVDFMVENATMHSQTLHCASLKPP